MHMIPYDILRTYIIMSLQGGEVYGDFLDVGLFKPPLVMRGRDNAFAFFSHF